MADKIEASDLAAMSKVAPEISALTQTDDEWWFGLFGVDKSDYYKPLASSTWPRWRNHFSNPVTEQMRLRVQPFPRANSEEGIGVVLVIPEEHYEQWVGWAREDRVDEIRSAVEFLNQEIATLWSLWDAAGRPRGDTPPSTAPVNA